MKTLAPLPKPITSKNPVTILRAVIAAIRAEPKRYDQSIFIERRDEYHHRDDDEYPKCGTICCVAGWTNIIVGETNRNYGEQEDLARKVLGLSEWEAEQLFDGNPTGVRDRGDVTPEEHAADGIAHIKRFVLKKWGKKI